MELNPETCMEGHWVALETADTLDDLMQFKRSLYEYH